MSFQPKPPNQASILYHECCVFLVQFSHSVVSNFLQPHESQHARPPCPLPTPRIYSNSCPLSWWWHSKISYSVIPFFSCLQSLPASGSFQMSQLFASGGQSIGVSASVSVLAMNIQDWSPLGWTDWICLLSKGLSRVFSSTTIRKYQWICGLFSVHTFYNTTQVTVGWIWNSNTLATWCEELTHLKRLWC